MFKYAVCLLYNVGNEGGVNVFGVGEPSGS